MLVGRHCFRILFFAAGSCLKFKKRIQKRCVLTNFGPPYLEIVLAQDFFPSKSLYFHFLRNEPQKDSGISFPICVSTQSWFFWYRGSICSTPTSLCSVFGPSPNALGRSSHYEQCSDSKSSLPSGFLCFGFFPTLFR